MVLKVIKLNDNLKDAFSFENVINDYNKFFYDNIEAIDMSQVSFIDPYSLIGLLLIGKVYLRLTGNKLKLINFNDDILNYCLRMNFFDYGIFDTINLEKYKKRKSLKVSNRLLEIIEIPAKESEGIKVIGKIINIFRERAKYILVPWFSESVIDYFITVISEICQNIYEHSMDSGFIAIQTYLYMGERIFKIAIGDAGIGIPESFSNVKSYKNMETGKLLKLVLTKPISSKRRFGYGLCQVHSIVEQLRGMLFLRSKDGYVSIIQHKKKPGNYMFIKDNCSNFAGTQISISFSG